MYFYLKSHFFHPGILFLLKRIILFSYFLMHSFLTNCTAPKSRKQSNVTFKMTPQYTLHQRTMLPWTTEDEAWILVLAHRCTLINHLWNIVVFLSSVSKHGKYNICLIIFELELIYTYSYRRWDWSWSWSNRGKGQYSRSYNSSW